MGRCREGIEKLTSARDTLQSLAAQDTANMQLQSDLQFPSKPSSERLGTGSRDTARRERATASRSTEASHVAQMARPSIAAS
jgi:hypothetical protein